MPPTNHPRPNFFIAGAPKTGTTSLYSYLRQHPQIYLSPVKEPCYFASEVRLEHFSREFESAARNRSRRLDRFLHSSLMGDDPGGIVTNWPDYLKLFANAGDGHMAIGEASVCYLWSPSAASNISACLPDARIIIILRDPAERAYSQYLQYAARGLVKRSFREHIECSARHAGTEFNTFYPFLEYGMYARQVRKYLEAFPPGNVRVYVYEEAWSDPPAFLNRIFRDLNVDPQFQPDMTRRELQRSAPRSMGAHYLLARSGLAPRLKAVTPRRAWDGLRVLLLKSADSLRMDDSDRRYLRDYYREDVLMLASLLNRDLDVWLA